MQIHIARWANYYQRANRYPSSVGLDANQHEQHDKEISADELTHIFDQFYRTPNVDPWNQGGTGLGLALVKKQMEHLDGKITVESTPRRLCFTVELPLIEQR